MDGSSGWIVQVVWYEHQHSHVADSETVMVTVMITVHETTVSVSCGAFTCFGQTINEATDRLLSEYTNRLRHKPHDKTAQEVVSALAKIRA